MSQLFAIMTKIPGLNSLEEILILAYGFCVFSSWSCDPVTYEPVAKHYFMISSIWQKIQLLYGSQHSHQRYQAVPLSFPNQYYHRLVTIPVHYRISKAKHKSLK